MDLTTAEGFRVELERLESESKHRRSAIECATLLKERLLRESREAEAELKRLTQQRDAAEARASMALWDLEQLSTGDTATPIKTTAATLATALTSQRREREQFRQELRDILTTVLPIGL